jgi:hypothetical protein
MANSNASNVALKKATAAPGTQPLTLPIRHIRVSVGQGANIP